MVYDLNFGPYSNRGLIYSFRFLGPYSKILSAINHNLIAFFLFPILIIAFAYSNSLILLVTFILFILSHSQLIIAQQCCFLIH